MMIKTVERNYLIVERLSRHVCIKLCVPERIPFKLSEPTNDERCEHVSPAFLYFRSLHPSPVLIENIWAAKPIFSFVFNQK